MIRFALTLPLLLSLSFCEADKTPIASDQISPNGTPYRLIQMPGNDYAAILAAWPNDWAWAEGRNPVAPYIGAQLILAGGAEGYPAGDLVKRFADMDDNGELHVYEDHLYGFLAAKKKDWSEAISIANAHLTRPSFDPDLFNRFRTAAEQAIAELQSQTKHQGLLALEWAVLGDHPLRAFRALDDPDQFAELTFDDLRAWHSATLTAQPEAVIVAGDVTPDQAGATLDALLAGLPNGKSGPREMVLDYRPRQILLHLPDATEAQLSFIAPLPASFSGLEDYILAAALGGSEDSVLIASVRDGLRASYSFNAGIGLFSDENVFLMMTSALETVRLAETVNVVRDAYADFRDAGPEGDIMNLVASYRSAFKRNQNHVLEHGRMALGFALEGLATGDEMRLPDLADALTMADLRNRLQDHWPKAQDFVILAVSPDADALPGACVITRAQDAKDC